MNGLAEIVPLRPAPAAHPADIAFDNRSRFVAHCPPHPTKGELALKRHNIAQVEDWLDDNAPGWRDRQIR